MISARELSKSYSDAHVRVQVLDHLTLEVPDGEVLAIVGRSGSGKTSLLNVLGALDGDFQGELEVRGQNVRALSDEARAHFRSGAVGFVFQSHHLIPNLPAWRNVALPAVFASGHEGDPRSRALEALQRVGLGTKADRRPAELSGGERQRVALARALFNHPPLLLCDEPTGNLDRATSQEIVELFRTLNRERGTTVVVATHEESLACAATRVLELVDGRLRGSS